MSLSPTIRLFAFKAAFVFTACLPTVGKSEEIVTVKCNTEISRYVNNEHMASIDSAAYYTFDLSANIYQERGKEPEELFSADEQTIVISSEEDSNTGEAYERKIDRTTGQYNMIKFWKSNGKTHWVSETGECEKIEDVPIGGWAAKF